MPLTIRWNDGVTVSNDGTELIFDPCRNSHSHSQIFVTHAHFDHSKGFTFRGLKKLSTEETKEIVSVYGRNIDDWQPISIGSSVAVDGVKVSSHNAGHVLGSALYEVTTPEANVVYTGDLQFKDSLTLKGASPVSCDVLVIECTFGLESFRFPERDTVIQLMVQWAHRVIREGRIPVFKADTLGNAQEVAKAFNLYSRLPVIVHQRVAQINEIYNAKGRQLQFLDAESEDASEIASSGECVFITPKNSNMDIRDKSETALVSGWAIWARKERNAFALSDHADFRQLMEFISACKPKAVLTCFGGKFDQVFAKQVQKRLRIEARPLKLISTEFLI